MNGNGFRFSAELFEHRNDALEALGDGGFAWMSDFASVDVLHDLYGVEVCGVAERETADAMLALLRSRFPAWKHASVILKDWGKRERGWRVRVHRDGQQPRDKWISTGG
jgi:hypothetical protein